MNELTTTPEGSWGTENNSSKDTLIPRIHVMQDLSDLVKKGKARPGQLVHSTTGEVLADVGKPFPVIPIYSYKDWIINDVTEDRGKTKEKYRARILMTPSNEGWGLEGVENGKAITRVRCMNFFFLAPGLIGDLPFLVTFKKTSTMAGKKLATYFQQCQMSNKPAPSQTWDLLSQSRTWEGFSFYAFDVEPGRTTTKEELAAAWKWYQILKSSDVKVDDEFKPADLEGPQF